MKNVLYCSLVGNFIFMFGSMGIPPQHPHLASDGMSNIHNDAYMSDVYFTSGPTASDFARQTFFAIGPCPTHTFDSAGRLITLCANKEGQRILYRVSIEPDGLHELAKIDLPSVANGMTFGGGAYFYLDAQSRVVVATSKKELWVVTFDTHSKKGKVVETYNLNRAEDGSAIMDDKDVVMAALPDWNGKYWFVSERGVVGFVHPESKRVRFLKLVSPTHVFERIYNSFAVDETGGVFVVSEWALYRLDTSGDGNQPVVTWREAYNRGNRQKPGQQSFGSGTTPTLMGQDWVTIADNADPHMQVLVYDRKAQKADRRLICSQGVFPANRGATENSLIAYDHSILVENNYGYKDPYSVLGKDTTVPGISRIDIDLSQPRGCSIKWTNDKIAVPSLVSKLNWHDKILYTYAKNSKSWYLAGLDFETGDFKFRVDTGKSYKSNNHFSAVSLAPDKSLLVGTITGIFRFVSNE